ncbi:putative transcriptional regulator, TetR family protein [Flexivirga endophytica]|uniref:Transcriptional regulator, TetR family protein n=1 Tax=Flexivirga endophytica TaxID=1849103 RepID=A0A916WX05_9MICO|nr:helix-turn-helix domain-containing protein [Flexivirga endophytica]GGB37184.1 putative transcriptional regulator, TetR family protein [Flexivirga endophytica]GHB44763.1 putative transcriptional regulator, TetR family protein [Flexivirga endophytica]
MAGDSRSGNARATALTRERILAVAAELVRDAEGSVLSMRTLGAQLGVTPMALYRHFASRDDLLVALLDGEFAEVDWPALPDPGVDRAVEVLLLLHRELAARPWVVDALTRGDLMAPSAARATDDVLASLLAAGRSPEQAAHRYSAAWRLILGATQLDARTRQAKRDLKRPTVQEAVRRDAAAKGLDALAVCGEALAAQRADFDMRTALVLIVQGVED